MTLLLGSWSALSLRQLSNQHYCTGKANVDGDNVVSKMTRVGIQDDIG